MSSAATDALDAYRWCQTVTDTADRLAALAVVVDACGTALNAAAIATVAARKERNIAEATT